MPTEVKKESQVCILIKNYYMISHPLLALLTLIITLENYETPLHNFYAGKKATYFYMTLVKDLLKNHYHFLLRHSTRQKFTT